MNACSELIIDQPCTIGLHDCPRDPAPLADDAVEGPTVVSLVSPGTELSWGFHSTTPGVKRTGYAAIFRIERRGAAVHHLAVGDLVFCMGNHRSWQRHQADHVVPVPKGLDPGLAVFTRLMAIGMAALTTTAARPPEPVVVSGLGIIGNLTAQIFHAAGYRTLGNDPVAARRTLLSDLGIDTCTGERPQAYADGQVRLWLDCSGHEASILAGIRSVRRGSEVVLVGVPWRRRTELTAQEILHAIFHTYAVVRTGWEWELPSTVSDFRPGNTRDNLAAGMEWIARGRIQVSNLAVEARPSDAQEVYTALDQQTWPALTALFRWP